MPAKRNNQPTAQDLAIIRSNSGTTLVKPNLRLAVAGMTCALLGLTGIFGCPSNPSNSSSPPAALSLEVDISAPDSVFVGETFTATANASGSTLVFDWSLPFSGTISNQNAMSPSITYCNNGDFTLSVDVQGALIPGVPVSGSATRTIHVYPPVAKTIADSEFSNSNWEVLLDYSCDEPIPDTYEFSAFQVADGGSSGPYRRQADFMLWPSDPGSLVMYFDHWYLAETFDPAVDGPIGFVRLTFFAQVIGDRQVAFIPIIRQNGKTFRRSELDSLIVSPEEDNWVAGDTLELSASQFFEECARGGELDFSTNGSPLEFGLRIHHRTYDVTDQPEQLFMNFDDFEFQIATPWSTDECITAAQPDDLCPDDPDKTEPGSCGCGIPDTDSDGDDIPDCLGSCPDIGGTWDLSVTNVTSSCGPEDDWSSTLTIVQTGCSLDINGFKDDPKVLSGTIVQNDFSVGPSLFDEDGGQTQSTFTFTVTSPTTMTGQENWNWNETGGSDSCEDGAATLRATKS